MIQMVNNINKSSFGGRQVITCYNCCHGNLKPRDIPGPVIQYACRKKTLKSSVMTG